MGAGSPWLPRPRHTRRPSTSPSLHKAPAPWAPAPAPPRALSLSPQPSPCLDGPAAGRKTGLGLTSPRASGAHPLCWLELGGTHPSPSGAPPPSHLLSDALQDPPLGHLGGSPPPHALPASLQGPRAATASFTAPRAQPSHSASGFYKQEKDSCKMRIRRLWFWH